MKKVVLIGLFLISFSLATAQASDLQQPEKVASEREELNRSREQLDKSREELDKSREELDRSREELDRSREELEKSRDDRLDGRSEEESQQSAKEIACECCRKCKAARSTIKPREEEGPPETNGCKDCCDRCGENQPPDPDQIPPEVIDDRIPPEIQEKSRPTPSERDKRKR